MSSLKGLKTQNGTFSIKVHFSRRNFATIFFYVKTFSDKVVRHSLAYLTVQKRLAWDVPFYRVLCCLINLNSSISSATFIFPTTTLPDPQNIARIYSVGRLVLVLLVVMRRSLGQIDGMFDLYSENAPCNMIWSANYCSSLANWDCWI